MNRERWASVEMQKYKIGDVVRVLPYEEIVDKMVNAHLDGGELPSGCYFVDSMQQYCGEQTTISECLGSYNGVGFYKLDVANQWYFTDEMLEDVIHYDTNKCIAMSYEDVMNGMCVGVKTIL